MTGKISATDLESMIAGHWATQPSPPAGLLEQRVMELESMGLSDEESTPGVPSSARQFATVSLLHEKPPFFVTLDADMLVRREALEDRYGLKILSVYEAAMLLNDIDGPPN